METSAKLLSRAAVNGFEKSLKKKFVNGFDIVNGAAVNGKYSANGAKLQKNFVNI